MRNYKKERENYHSRPEQKIRNAARKRARRQMEKEGKAKLGDGKDVHHKDNDPLNNDKKNLSLVTQHYNRKEPRIREKKLKHALRKEDAAAAANLKAKQAAEVEALKDKQEGEIEALKAKHEREGERQKKQDEGEAEAEKARDAREEVDEANAISMSNPNAKRMIGLMQKYFNTKDKDKKAIFFIWDAPFAKIITSFGEDMGTVTGTHIAGTGDDSSTVVVKKKKKKKVYRRESLKKRIIDHVLAIQQKV